MCDIEIEIDQLGVSVLLLGLVFAAVLCARWRRCDIEIGIDICAI